MTAYTPPVAYGARNHFEKATKFPSGCSFGNDTSFGSGMTFESSCTFGDDASFADKTKLVEPRFSGTFNAGDKFKLIGTRNEIPSYSHIGNNADLGSCVRIGDHVTIGHDCNITSFNCIGADFQFGQRLTLARRKVIVVAPVAFGDHRGLVVVHTKGVAYMTCVFEIEEKALSRHHLVGKYPDIYLALVKATAATLVAGVEAVKTTKAPLTGGW